MKETQPIPKEFANSILPKLNPQIISDIKKIRAIEEKNEEMIIKRLEWAIKDEGK